MSETVKLPALGESVSEATVTRWLKKLGESVIAGEPLVEVSTDKVDTEVVSDFTGVVTEILVDEDMTVEVGTALAVISEWSTEGLTGYAAVSDPAPVRTPVPEPVAESILTASSFSLSAKVAQLRSERRIAIAETAAPFVTLLVRRAAKDRGLDLSKIVGTGPHGRIRRVDLPGSGPPQQFVASENSQRLTMTMDLDVTVLGRGSVAATLRQAAQRAIQAVPAFQSAARVPVRVADDNEYHSETPFVGAFQAAAISIGARRQVPVVMLTETAEAIAIGRVVTASVSFDPAAIESDQVLRLLTTLRSEIASHL